jgi:hypothetical protein
LANVRFTSETPPAVGADAFQNVDPNARAIVPSSWGEHGVVDGQFWNGLIISFADGIVFLTPLQAALVAAVTPSVENPAIPANLGATQLTLGELAGLRRFNVRGLNWANSAFLVERNAIGAAQRAVIERMLEGAAEVGASGAFFDNLTPLQLALARAVTPSATDPAIPANLGATQLTLGELAGLRRFNVRGLNWANTAFLVERNAIGTAQRAVIERMLDALKD